MKYQYGAMIVYVIVLFAWTIYGYVLFFGSDNDCQEHAGTSGWLVFMVILLVLVLLAFAFLVCCLLPIALFIWYMQRQNSSGPENL